MESGLSSEGREVAQRATTAQPRAVQPWHEDATCLTGTQPIARADPCPAACEVSSADPRKAKASLAEPSRRSEVVPAVTRRRIAQSWPASSPVDRLGRPAARNDAKGEFLRRVAETPRVGLHGCYRLLAGISGRGTRGVAQTGCGHSRARLACATAVAEGAGRRSAMPQRDR